MGNYYYVDGTYEEIQELENKLRSLSSGVDLIQQAKKWSKVLALPYITCLNVMLDEYSKGHWH